MIFPIGEMVSFCLLSYFTSRLSLVSRKSERSGDFGNGLAHAIRKAALTHFASLCGFLCSKKLHHSRQT